MLVTFKTEAYASITMFGDVANALLKLMGHSGTIPGALMPEDIPAALERLKAGVAANPDATLDPQSAKRDSDEDDEPLVSLANRALPLIELLTAAKAENKHVMWDS
jgi:hypothetical protein